MSINSKTKAAVDTLLTDNATTESEFQTGLQDVTTELDAAQVKLSGYETSYSLTGTDIDPANGAIQYKTLTANTTFTESLADGQSVLLRIAGGDTYTITWPTLTWVTSAGNAAPTQTASDVYVLWQEGTTVYAAYTGNYV